jgi:hypothetical protein
MNNLKFVRIEVDNGQPGVVFEITRCANSELIRYDKHSFDELFERNNGDEEMCVIKKYLDDYEDNLRKVFS